MAETSPFTSAFSLTERRPNFTFATVCIGGSHVRIATGQICEGAPSSAGACVIDVCEAVSITPCDGSCQVPSSGALPCRDELLRRLPSELPPHIEAKLYAYETRRRAS